MNFFYQLSVKFVYFIFRGHEFELEVKIILHVLKMGFVFG